MNTPAFLIDNEDHDGPLNMALDEVLWREAAVGKSFFRLYKWLDRPVLSLGYFQSSYQLRCDPRLSRLPYVRRLTGGGAIVHDRELTYSLATPAWLAPPTGELYERFHRAVVGELVRQGIPANLGDCRLSSERKANLCFHRTDRYAIRVYGAKVLGSAQRRGARAVMMHGSLLLASSPAAPQLAGLNDILGRDCCEDDCKQALVRAAASALRMELEATGLAEDLRYRSNQLADSKYRTAGWNDLDRRTEPDVCQTRRGFASSIDSSLVHC